MKTLLYNLNHAALWRRRLSIWDRQIRTASLDRLVFLLLHRFGWMGAQEVRLLRQFIRPGMRIVDLGANIGLYSLLLSRLTGQSGQVYSFEPEPNLFATLRENCTANGVSNIVAFPYAAGASAGRAHFQRSPLNSGNNSLLRAPAGADSLEVELVTVDGVLPERVIDFVKIDVQGHELAALLGMEQVLAASPQVRVYFEFWPAGLRAAGSSPEQLLAFFHERGFTVYRPQERDFPELTDPQHLIQDLGKGGYVNLLASRSEIVRDE